MTSASLLPSLRSRVGDWNFYVTTLTFKEVTSLIKAPDEIHERKKLGDWIQREAIESHANSISSYIRETPQRFLGSLIVGVYGGAPDWTQVDVQIPENDISTVDQRERVEGSFGLLRLSGAEKLFAIDGQHRVAGIKKALQQADDPDSLGRDSVSAIFVAHDPESDEGKKRTRRLFTTVNKKARIISKAAKIALDEDDGFAIVTRQLIDTHRLFADEHDYLLYASGGAIPANDVNSLTTVVGLFEIVKALYGGPKGAFENNRPAEDAITSHVNSCIEFFNELIDQIPEFKDVFDDRADSPGNYRLPGRNHMLFRPAGQQVFARAVQLLVSRGDGIAAAVKKLRGVELYLQKEPWHHLMWNPISKTMISNKVSLAEAQLLELSKQEPRDANSKTKLASLFKSIANGSI